MDDGKSPLLLDVREDYEREVSCINGSVHVPLGALIADPSALEITKEADIVVYCRSGMRSQTACAFLNQHGFLNVFNLKGGIAAWKQEIQPEMPVA